jgi:hypothetical protein
MNQNATLHIYNVYVQFNFFNSNFDNSNTVDISNFFLGPGKTPIKFI